MGFARSVFCLLAICGTANCSGEGTSAAVTLKAAAEHLPCAGIQRLRVTAFYDESHGQGLDVLGRFYDQQGGCLFPAGWQVELAGLPFSGGMWLMVEGFDSTSNRRLALARSQVFSRSQVESGALPDLVLEREARNQLYPVITLVLQIPGLDQLGPADLLEYNLNFSNPASPNAAHGSFFRGAGGELAGPPLVLSGLIPETGNNLLVAARRGAQTVASWRAENFEIPEGGLFVDLQLEQY
jgi:hypothetical protein